MTLDDSGHAVIWEVLTDDSGMPLIFVATPLEEAARKEFGDPLPGRRYSIEADPQGAPNVIVPRVISPGPVPMGPFLYLDGPSHSVATLICRCMPSQFDDLAGDRQYELRPLSELEGQGLNTSRWSLALPRQDEGEESFDDADVLRRAATLTGEAQSLWFAGIARDDLLDDDVVSPVVPEIVDVEKPITGPADHIAELGIAVRQEPVPRLVELRHGCPVSFVRDAELVQVGIGPAHGALEDVVELFEVDVAGDQDPTPDRRIGVFEVHVELNNGTAVGHHRPLLFW